jgi:hypothetical protein
LADFGADIVERVVVEHVVSVLRIAASYAVPNQMELRQSGWTLVSDAFRRRPKNSPPRSSVQLVIGPASVQPATPNLARVLQAAKMKNPTA